MYPHQENNETPSLILPQKAALDQNWAKQYIDNYWLGLGDTSNIEISNPFDERTQFEIENPHIHILDVMRQPEYFGFTCKHLFNKTLYPFQIAILQQLWKYPFPMLIGSRGMGKCVTGDTLIHTSNGIHRISELAGNAICHEKVFHRNLTILGENGYKPVAYAWNNGRSQVKRISTLHNFELAGTLNHPIRVATDNGIEWKNLEDVKAGDWVIIDRSQAWHKPENSLPNDLAYLLGLIASNGGCATNGAISFYTQDSEILQAANSIAQVYFGKPFKRSLNSRHIHMMYSVSVFDRLFREFGFNSLQDTSVDVPTSILRGSKPACAAFLRGLFDVDGRVVSEEKRISLRVTSPFLAKTVQFVLTKFGIIASRRLRKTWARGHHWLLELRGNNVSLFRQKIGFGKSKKKKSLDKMLSASPAQYHSDIIPPFLVNDYLRELGVKRIFSNGISYKRLGRILKEHKEHSSTVAWQRLNELHTKHWFFDRIDVVADDEDITYDVHVPDDHSFVSNGLVSHNSFLLALYAMLKALFCQGSKIIIVGAAFRQAKVVFDYCQELWEQAPVLRSLVGKDKRFGPKRDIDRCHLRMGDSIIIALPLGDGTKIRGQRANVIIADEFASISKEIFETVIRGFAAVNLNPVMQAQQASRKQALKDLGMWNDAQAALDEALTATNQSIISGTAYYSFNHFYDYWKKWHAIVESKGDFNKLAEIHGGPDKVDPNLDWRDFCVIRVPVKSIPEGFMNPKMIAQAKATIDIGTYQMEYGAVFATDSNGFFKRSLIESCVVGKDNNPIERASCGLVRFNAVVRGHPDRTYVMAIDPASERDNFSIVILECWPDHRRIVYCWTTTRARYKAQQKRGLTQRTEYYWYCADKIRELLKLFPCERIAIDSQGGGVSIMEALQDSSRAMSPDDIILPVIDEDKPKETDAIQGRHIIEVINFAKADWVSAANHGMKKDLMEKALLFPEFDPAVVELAFMEDKEAGRIKVDSKDIILEKLYDTLEDCVLEIEELKDELASIQHTQTGVTLRDKWDTPEIKMPGNKKGRLRKDRYSALLMANMVARTLQRTTTVAEYSPQGGFAKEIVRGKTDMNGVMWINRGPEGAVWAKKWKEEWTDGANYGAVVNRNR